jgi:hypothetical protein
MKHRLWILNLPVILLFTTAFYIGEAGVQGELDHPMLRDQIFPSMRSVTGWFTNRKFQLRGEHPTTRPEDEKNSAAPKIRSRNKIVIVDVDNQSIEMIGRIDPERVQIRREGGRPRYRLLGIRSARIGRDEASSRLERCRKSGNLFTRDRPDPGENFP